MSTGWATSRSLRKFDELSAAVTVSDQGIVLAGEQINPGQQAERAMAFTRGQELGSLFRRHLDGHN
jgi:hypothetical protein